MSIKSKFKNLAISTKLLAAAFYNSLPTEEDKKVYGSDDRDSTPTFVTVDRQTGDVYANGQLIKRGDKSETGEKPSVDMNSIERTLGDYKSNISYEKNPDSISADLDEGTIHENGEQVIPSKPLLFFNSMKGHMDYMEIPTSRAMHNRNPLIMVDSSFFRDKYSEGGKEE